jgi:hypothetical protein
MGLKGLAFGAQDLEMAYEKAATVLQEQRKILSAQTDMTRKVLREREEVRLPPPYHYTMGVSYQRSVLWG